MGVGKISLPKIRKTYARMRKACLHSAVSGAVMPKGAWPDCIAAVGEA